MLQVKLEKPHPRKVASISLGKSKTAIFDREDLPTVLLYHWRLVRYNFRYYAYSSRMVDGSRCSVTMHRLLGNTPKGEVCHHCNKITLDNRKCNLLNLLPRHHRELHGIRRFGRKNKKKATIVKKTTRTRGTL